MKNVNDVEKEPINFLATKFVVPAENTLDGCCGKYLVSESNC
jgi:hypothetical protein